MKSNVFENDKYKIVSSSDKRFKVLCNMFLDKINIVNKHAQPKHASAHRT